MQNRQKGQKTTKNDQKGFIILFLPQNNQLKQVFSLSREVKLYYYAHKKMTLALSEVTIQKKGIRSNMQIFQWRSQTQFPVIKTLFIKIKQKNIDKTQLVTIQVYYQHCPLRLSQIFQIPTNQAMYLLKEALVGFERLFNRFGGFDIQNSMIAINQKGKCKIWMNQQFYLNSCYKRKISQNRMVNKIITIIQSHSQQSKMTKKLFSYLKKCETFLNSLRTLELFSQSEKIIVPNKFSRNQSIRIYERYEPCKDLKVKDQKCSITQLSKFRISLKVKKLNIHLQSPEKDKKRKSPSFLKNRQSLTPSSMNRSKSQKIVQTNLLLKSSNKTAQTHHTILGASGYFGSEQTKNKIIQFQSKPIQQSKTQNFYQSIKIKRDTYQRLDQQKKSSTHPQASKSKQMKSTFQSSNDYTQKLVKDNYDKSHLIYQFFGKASIDQPFFKQFQQLFADNQEQEIKIEKNKLKLQNKKVYRNNGWIQRVSGLIDCPGKLQKSFQQDQKVKKDELGEIYSRKIKDFDQISIFSFQNQQHG